MIGRIVLVYDMGPVVLVHVPSTAVRLERRGKALYWQGVSWGSSLLGSIGGLGSQQTSTDVTASSSSSSNLHIISTRTVGKCQQRVLR